MTSGLKTRLDDSDYVHIRPDRNRREILDGEPYVTPAPSPLDVILTPHDVVPPDLVVVTDPA